MTFLQFLNKRKAEFLLVLISAWATSVVALNGFYLDNLLEQIGYAARAGIAFGIDFVLVFALYAASFNREHRARGIVLYALLVVALAAVAMFISTNETSIYTDSEGNYLYFIVDVVFATTTCFLLTRTLTGSMIWFVVTAFSCSVVQAFYNCEEIPLTLVAAVCAIALIVFRNFRMGMDNAQIAQKTTGGHAFVSAVVPTLVVCGLAVGIWYFIIAPLGPGVLDIKLVTDYRTLPVEEFIGTAEKNPQRNYDLTSQNLVDGFAYTTDDLVEDPTSSKTVDAASVLEQNELDKLSKGEGAGGASGGGSSDTLKDDSLDPEYDTQSYSKDFPWTFLWIFLVVAFIAFILAYFFGRRALRMRATRKCLALEPREQLKALYRSILKKLEIVGFSQPEGMTLREFAVSSERGMDMLNEETGISFRQLTETYITCVYDEDFEPTEDDIVPFVAYQLRFCKAARTHLGNMKYFFKSFRL